MKSLQRAQKDLDVAIADYYRRNEDGGNIEERMVIAARIARRFGLDPKEEEQLSY